MNGIDIRLLQAAIAVAEELSFSRAAARLHITQPALSKQIHDLEGYVGVPLFERNNQGVELTEACRSFIEEARLSVHHLERAVHRARTIARGAEAILHFGSSPSVDPYLLTTVLSLHLPLFPTLRIHKSSNFSPELSRKVMTGELDAALVTSVPSTPRLNFLEVATAPFYVVFREEDELSRRHEIRLKDCDRRGWALFGRHLNPSFYDTFMIRARGEDATPDAVHDVTTAEEAAQFISLYDGVAFLTRMGAWRIARSGLTMRPLIEDGLNLKTMLVTRGDDRTRLISEFLRAAVRKLENDSGLQQQQLAFTG
jgi:DNA-binding transcriptional LysR family regulator